MQKDRSWLFVLITYCFTWAIELPVALNTKGIISLAIPKSLQTFASWAPGIVAIAMALLLGKTHITNLVKGVFKWKVGIGWYAAVIFLGLSVSGLSLLSIYVFTDLTTSLDPPYSIFFLLIILFFFSPLWEEIGWRGFLLPRLQQRYSPLKASLIIGLIWGVWHLPIILALNSYGDKTIVFFIFLFLGCFPISILQTWIYNSTRGSILLCIIFHDAINVGASYFYMNLSSQEMRPFQISVLLFACAAAVVYYRDKKLAYH